MSDVEVQDPVVQSVEKDEVSPLAEDTSPKPDSQEVPEEIVDLSDERKTIPKDRFDQVWARSKKAEARLDQLQADLQREREERIRLEERSKIQQEQQSQREMTWAELETGIAEGKWTRDQAHDYKDKMTEQRLRQEFKREKEAEASSSRVLREISVYQQLIPDVMTYGSENRLKYEREYQYLIGNGAPKNHTTELAAVRAAFGSPEAIKARQTKPLTNKEPLMETHTPSRQTTPKKNYEDTLPSHVRTHYEKLMKGGVIPQGDWKRVEQIEKRRAK